MPLQNLSFKGTPIYYADLGKGYPLVFLHGFNESIDIWNNIIDDISKQYRCILIDLPGFGNSPLPVHLSIKYMAESVKRVIDETEILKKNEKPILIGHSMGAYVALEYLKHFEDTISGIGFIHSSAIADSDEKKENRKKTLEFLEKNEINAFFKIFIQGLVAPHNYKKSIIEEIEKIICKTSSQSVKEGIKAMLYRTDNFEIYKKSTIPYLMLAGKYDQLILLDKILEQSSQAQNVMIEILKNTGHLGMIEEPEKTRDTIINYAKWVEYLNKKL